MKGYTVNSRVALSLLERRSPEAFGWWKENAPHFLGETFVFVFDEACAELVE